MQQRMSAKEYQQMLREQAKKKPSKHRNKYIYVYADGFFSDNKTLTTHGTIIRKYDSRKEFQRHKELELLQKSGKIRELQWQVPILISEAFIDKNGKKHQEIYYKADFMYVEDDLTVVEDVKGIDRLSGKVQATEAFRIKWKLLQAKYGEWEFRIV